MNMMCNACGNVYPDGELLYVTIREDYGDVCVWKCPRCHRVDYDGMNLITAATDAGSAMPGAGGGRS